MTKFVIGPDVALRIAAERPTLNPAHQLLAPTLLRSQALALLYHQVRQQELTRGEAEQRLDHLRSLKLRLLGDRVLQRTAWRLAEQLDWPDTLDAEYLALTRLQANAFVTLDDRLAAAARPVVTVAGFDALLRS